MTDQAAEREASGPLTAEEEAMARAIAEYWRRRYGDGDASAQADNPHNIEAAREIVALFDAERAARAEPDPDGRPPLPRETVACDKGFMAGVLNERERNRRAARAEPGLRELRRKVVRLDVNGTSSWVSGFGYARDKVLDLIDAALEAHGE